MFRQKINTVCKLPVRLYDTTGAVVGGVLAANAAAWICKGDGTRAQITIDGVNSIWSGEIVDGTFSGKGFYVLTIAAGLINVLGPTSVSINGVNGGTTGTAVGEFEVVTNLESDVYTRLGAPAGASIAADIAAIKSDTGSNVTNIGLVKAKTDNLPADPASNTQVNTRLAASTYVAPDNASITAIKAKTDNLPAVPASQADVTGARDSIKGASAKDLTQVFNEVDTRATPADVQVTVNGGFTAGDRTKLQAIPSNPVLTNDARLDYLDVAVSTRTTPGDGVFTNSDRIKLDAIPVNTLLSDDMRLNMLDVAISTRATPSDVQVTVDGGFTAGDRTKLTSIPSDPVLVGDVRLPAVGSGKVVAAISDLPPAPDNTKIGEIDTALTALEKVVLRIVALLGENRISDNEIIDESGRVISARIRIYATKAAADAEDPAGLLCTYTLVSSYNLDGTAVMKVTGIAL